MGLVTGAHLGPYEIQSAIGSGGMGEVYCAYDSRLNRSVAIKVLPQSLIDSQSARERFQREARAVAALHHPNICAVYDVGETADHQHFLVMEMLEGETLQSRLTRAPLEVTEFLAVAGALANALEAAHQAGIIHRDIKPANIFLTAHGPKILDFGLAKDVSEVTSAGASMQPTRTVEPLLTATGGTPGTLAYMAPEQLRGEAVDVRSDIFSLGLVLYEMATGRPAFTGATATALGSAILTEAPTAPRQVRPELSPSLEHVILRALEKDRGLRYQTASDLGADLKRVKREMESGSAFSVPALVIHKRRSRLIAAAAALVLLVAAIVVVFASRRTPALTDRDTILIADFVNTTGDPVFDGALKQALAVALEQSPFLSIVSDQRIQETLRYMGRKPDELVTRGVAHEICQREQVKAFLVGSIANLSGRYLITLEAIKGLDGDVLARSQVEAATKDQVVRAVGSAASTLRGKLGETLASIERFDVPLMRATTSSLEAFKAYSLGRELQLKGKSFEAIRSYQRAIELDPDFALAYNGLAAAYQNSNQLALSDNAAAKAYGLKDRVSERERLIISGGYMNRTGEFEKVIETLGLFEHTYPRDPAPQNTNIAGAYNRLGQPEKAIDQARLAISLRGVKAWQPYANLAHALMVLKRFHEAKDVLEQALGQQIDHSVLRNFLYQIAFVGGDGAGMTRQVNWAASQSGDHEALTWQGWAAAFGGELRKAHELARLGRALAERRGLRDVAAQLAAFEAMWDAMVGACESARALAVTALTSSPEITVFTLVNLNAGDAAARALGACGDRSRAQDVVNTFATRYPNATVVHGLWVPVITAALDIHDGQPAKAVETLKRARPYERAWTAKSWPASLRAQAYLQQRMGPEAAVEYQSVLDHRGDDPLSPLYSLAHLGLARAKALSGDIAASRKSYQDFLTLWKDADGDIPVLKEAKREFAALK